MILLLGETHKVFTGKGGGMEACNLCSKGLGKGAWGAAQ
jgi:hypothetical protein